MKLELKGAVCVITGRMKTMTKARATQLVTCAGGRVASSVSGKTTFVVVLDRESNDASKAIAMGLPILEEDEFRALISGESVEVDEVGAAGDRSVDELLGEVRSVMQGAPSTEMWHALIPLLDACREQDVHILTEYVDGYMTRWAQGLQVNVRIESELRVAPEHWVGEMQQGVESPKFRCVRALDLGESGVTSRVIIGLLDHPDLIHLQSLKLSMYLNLSTALVKRLCKDERLRELGLGKVEGKQGTAFLKYGERATGLVSLDLNMFSGPYSHPESRYTCDFLGAPYFKHVESLVLRPYDSGPDLITQASHIDMLKEVRHIRVARGHDIADIITLFMKAPWFVAHASTFVIEGLAYNVHYDRVRWKAFWKLDYSGHLDLLDVSALHDLEDATRAMHVAHMLMSDAPTSTLLDSVDALVLGRWKTPELCEAILAHHPDLKVL